MMKLVLKFAVFFLILIFIWRFSGVLVSERETNIELTLNDVLIESEGMIYKENIVMIQLDWLAEIMNAEIQENNRKITIILGDDELCISKLSSEAKLNGERYKLSNAPIYENGEIFVPMRSIVEAFDWVLVYNQTVNLYTPQYWSEKTKEQ